CHFARRPPDGRSGHCGTTPQLRRRARISPRPRGRAPPPPRPPTRPPRTHRRLPAHPPDARPSPPHPPQPRVEPGLTRYRARLTSATVDVAALSPSRL